MSYQFPHYDTNILTLRHKVTERQLSRALVNPTNCLPGLICGFYHNPRGVLRVFFVPTRVRHTLMAC